METVIIVAVAFWLGWKINEIWMAATFKKILDDLGVTDRDLRKLAEQNGITLPEQPSTADSPKTEVEIRIEEVDGALLAYDSRNSFVAQAQDPDALLSRLIECFPAGTRITVPDDQGGTLIKAAAERMKKAL